jgi:hypothetical protein
MGLVYCKLWCLMSASQKVTRTSRKRTVLLDFASLVNCIMYLKLLMWAKELFNLSAVWPDQNYIIHILKP